jgi:hypothetical protein
VKSTLKMTAAEAIYGCISTCNSQQRAAALRLNHVLRTTHYFSVLAKHDFSFPS